MKASHIFIATTAASGIFILAAVIALAFFGTSMELAGIMGACAAGVTLSVAVVAMQDAAHPAAEDSPQTMAIGELPPPSWQAAEQAQAPQVACEKPHSSMGAVAFLMFFLAVIAGLFAGIIPAMFLALLGTIIGVGAALKA